MINLEYTKLSFQASSEEAQGTFLAFSMGTKDRKSLPLVFGKSIQCLEEQGPMHYFMGRASSLPMGKCACTCAHWKWRDPTCDISHIWAKATGATKQEQGFPDSPGRQAFSLGVDTSLASLTTTPILWLLQGVRLDIAALVLQWFHWKPLESLSVS